MKSFQAFINDLELQSWHYQEDFLDSKTNNNLLEIFKSKSIQEDLAVAAIGRNFNQVVRLNIRIAKTHWIDNWEDDPALISLKVILNDLMISLNEHFFLSMKRFESQFALYPEGGFYKKHIDQHRDTRNRLITCIFYFNDCPDHGELILYDKADKSKISKVIFPKAGSMVIFFSGHIYHEVKAVKSERYGLTSWMRNDEIIPLY